MSAFAPVDVRGPDQRRKKLLQKLLEQQMRAGRATPLPRAANPLLAVGRTFKGGGSPAKPNVTQRSNVLPSVLARLGVTGHQLPEEASSAAGVPIPAPRATPGPPQPVGLPIPSPPLPGVGGGPAGQLAPAAAMPEPASQPYHATTYAEIGATPNAITSDMVQPVNNAITSDMVLPPGQMQSDPVMPTSQLQQASLVPLGGGLYYDPVLDTVTGHPTSSFNFQRIVNSKFGG